MSSSTAAGAGAGSVPPGETPGGRARVHDAIVVGAGIAGLTLAHRLRRAGLDVLVLEQSSRAGGLIRSLEWEGALCEAGPSSFLATEPLLALIAELGLQGEVRDTAPAARNRYVVRGRRLKPVPLSAGTFLTTGLLSAKAKARLLLEPLLHGKRPRSDESVHAFFERHLGAEAVRYLVAPFVSGVYAGDPERLSARAAFPRVAELEERHPSLAFAALFKRPKPKPGPVGPAETPDTEAAMVPAARTRKKRLRSIALRAGNEALPKALASALEGGLRLGAFATSLAFARTALEVTLANGEALRARTVALTTAAAVSARLVEGSWKTLARALDAFPAPARVAVVHVLVDRVQLLRSLDGFGHLVPRGEGLRHLGCIWSSSLFPGRAPAGKALLQVYLGGALDPEAVTLPDAELLMLVDRELKTLGLYVGEPSALRRDPGPAMIAQYDIGHLARVAEAERLAGNVPGLFLGGSGYRGIAVGECVREADALASRIRAYLGK